MEAPYLIYFSSPAFLLLVLGFFSHVIIVLFQSQCSSCYMYYCKTRIIIVKENNKKMM